MIAALYVETGGGYFGLEGVDPWDETRDARKYAGPWLAGCSASAVPALGPRRNSPETVLHGTISA
ncbi:hypothetical protein ACVIRO_002362 [Rhizobium ruizarguesonis]